MTSPGSGWPTARLIAGRAVASLPEERRVAGGWAKADVAAKLGTSRRALALAFTIYLVQVA